MLNTASVSATSTIWPAARRLPLVERDQRADERLQRGDRVTEAEPHAGGRAVRLAGQVAQPAGRLGDRPEAGLVAQRTGLAIARDPDDDQAAGWPPSRSRGRGSRPRGGPAGSSRSGCRSRRPGHGRGPGRQDRAGPPQPSACRATGRGATGSRPRPSVSPQARSGSPWTGCSTLMTSAPKSASQRPASGPAISVPSSSTRRSASGPRGPSLGSLRTGFWTIKPHPCDAHRT